MKSKRCRKGRARAGKEPVRLPQRMFCNGETDGIVVEIKSSLQRRQLTSFTA